MKSEQPVRNKLDNTRAIDRLNGTGVDPTGQMFKESSQCADGSENCILQNPTEETAIETDENSRTRRKR